MSKKKLTANERYVYGAGMNSMWTAFRCLSYNPEMTLTRALYELACWIDEMLQPWTNAEIDDVKDLDFNELISPPWR